MNFAPASTPGNQLHAEQCARRISWLPLVAILLLTQPAVLLAGFQDPGAESEVAPKNAASDDTQKDDNSAEVADLVSSKLAAIPDPRSLNREDLPRIFMILDEGIEAGRKYVTEFPEGEEIAAVCCDLGRLLILNVDRHIAILNEEAKIFGADLTADQRFEELVSYMSEVLDLADRALAEEISSKFRCKAQVLRADCLLKMRRPSDAADSFAQALQQDTSEVDLDELRIKQIEALEIAERYPEMLRAGKLCLEKHPRSTFLPHLVYFTHKAHRHMGVLENGRELWRTWGPVLKAGALGGEIEIPGSDEKWQVPEGKEKDFAMMAERAGFYEGFYQLAMGNRDAALKAMISYNDELYDRINRGETLSMTTKTYLEFQSLPMAQRIDVLHGRAAPSLDGLRWIDPPPEPDVDKKLELRLFCDSSRANGRQVRLISLLRKLEHEYSADGLRVVWVSGVLRKERGNIEANAMTEIAIRKKLGWAYGVQEGQDQGVLERHLVNFGGTLLMAIDAKGILRWEVIDPMFWDEGLYRAIITRLLNEAD
ncbi:MAG: hypothetical protein VX764_02145 [Planctomycetota bacterium]|nr:hypothetical protein [Planctomycetota bacterium]